MKIIGTRKERTPLECIQAQNKLISELEKLRPYKKKKGIVLKFRTYEELIQFDLERITKLNSPIPTI